MWFAVGDAPPLPGESVVPVPPRGGYPIMTPLEQVLMVIVGVAFVAGGAVIAKGSIDSKNLIEVAIFGLLEGFFRKRRV